MSLLTVFAELFELVAFHRINKHLKVHNILSEDKFGFRKGLPTISAI